MTRSSATRSSAAAPRRLNLLGTQLEQAIFVGVQHWLDRDHRTIYRAFRRWKPVASLRFPLKMTLVSRRDDVLDLLAKGDTFVAAYAPHLPGPFILGAEGDAHKAFADGLREAVSPDDAERVAGLATAAAQEHLAHLGPGSTFDVGADVVRPALDRIIDKYLGVPGPDDLSNRCQQTQWQWAEDMFEEIFLNSANQALIRRRANIAARQMSAHVESLIAARRAKPTADAPIDVLGRLLQTGLNPEQIRFSLIGLAIGWLWHGARAALIAVDMLLDDPVALDEARRAAQDTEDQDWLRRVLWEALRFRPVQPFVLRTCPHEAVIAEGTPRQTRVLAGTLIAAGTHSAMWDDEVIPSPERFDSTRTEDQYLIFGSGRHRCLGQAIVGRQLPELLRPVLALDGLRRACGPLGHLSWHRARPVGLHVTWASD